MIGLVASSKARPSRAPKLAEAMESLRVEVRADEPDNILYQIMRSRDERDTFVALELFRSEAVLRAHEGSVPVVRLRSKLSELLDEPPKIQFLDELRPHAVDQ